MPKSTIQRGQRAEAVQLHDAQTVIYAGDDAAVQWTQPSAWGRRWDMAPDDLSAIAQIFGNEVVDNVQWTGQRVPLATLFDLSVHQWDYVVGEGSRDASAWNNKVKICSISALVQGPELLKLWVSWEDREYDDEGEQIGTALREWHATYSGKFTVFWAD